MNRVIGKVCYFAKVDSSLCEVNERKGIGFWQVLCSGA